MLSTYLILALAAISAISRPAVAQQPGPAKANSEGQTSNLETIVSQLEKAQVENRQHYQAYTLVRDYQLFIKAEPKPSSEVLAQVNFVPPGNKSYQIQRVTGSSRGEKVVRRVLDQETRMARQESRDDDTTLDRQNYNFTFLGTASIDGKPCYLLGLQPKQKRKNLVLGRAWIDQSTYLPRLIDGDLIKSPSWWLKKVHVSLSFNDMGGMWLQSGARAVADVRFLGEHTLTSQSIDYRTASSVALNSQPVTAARPVPRKYIKRLRPTVPASGIFGARVLSN
jgi:hypothetical protein